MKTEVLPVNAASISRAASLLQSGELVAFPTETVYGLGADALNADAVAKIFEAKGRPSDNPLIAHIAEKSAVEALVSDINDTARKLMDAFWPGPLTLVLPRTSLVPDIVSAGLSTVAVRMPSHPAALALIRAAGRPVAAPSANRSGRPSPTTAAHVLEDMQGRIPLILDGGACGVGVESTVVDVTGTTPVVLRPGGITMEMMRNVVPGVLVDDAVLNPLVEGSEARSPGMRHRHYAPEARVVVVRGSLEKAIAKMCLLYDEAARVGEKAAILCSKKTAARCGNRDIHVLGENAAEMSARLFDALRTMDEKKMDLVIAEASDTGGMGLALMNRLLRAADFDVVEV